MKKVMILTLAVFVVGFSMVGEAKAFMDINSPGTWKPSNHVNDYRALPVVITGQD